MEAAPSEMSPEASTRSWGGFTSILGGSAGTSVSTSACSTLRGGPSLARGHRDSMRGNPLGQEGGFDLLSRQLFTITEAEDAGQHGEQ